MTVHSQIAADPKAEQTGALAVAPLASPDVETHIPLNKLKKSPRNVRKVEHAPADIEAFAASLKVKGLLQNLVVEPEIRDGVATGYYLVTAGEGRRLGLKLLAKRKQIAKTHAVRCVIEGALERRNHWEKTSHSLLVGVLLHVLYAENDKTLSGVANFLADPARPIETTLRAMMTTPHLGDRPHPVVASAARELLNKSDNERSGVLSTAMSFLGLYRDPVVAKVTRQCDWRITDLVLGPKPVSLYLVVPPSDISRTKPLIRLILNQIGRRLTEELDVAGDRRRLLLMLDEFPALGRLDFFEQALAFMAGYRLKAVLIAQSLNQIEKSYGATNAVLDNCHVRVAFATNDERTAKRISDTLGTATEMRAMKNYAGSRLSPWLSHLMVSRQETARPLLTPGEVMQLPPDQALVLAAGAAPIRALKVRYYEDRGLAGRVRPPPAEKTVAGGTPSQGDWGGQVAPSASLTPAKIASDEDEGGLRREPEIPGHESAETPAASPDPEDHDVAHHEEGDEPLLDPLSDRFKAAARQAALDPGDGIPL